MAKEKEVERLIKPTSLEEQYEAVESYCESRNVCYRRNSSLEEDEDIF